MPQTSFRDYSGKLCRHAIYINSTQSVNSRLEVSAQTNNLGNYKRTHTYNTSFQGTFLEQNVTLSIFEKKPQLYQTKDIFNKLSHKIREETV